MHPDAQNHVIALNRMLTQMDPFQTAPLLDTCLTIWHIPPFLEEEVSFLTGAVL